MNNTVIFLSEEQQNFSQQYSGLQVTRVASQHHNLYSVLDTNNHSFQAIVSGKLNHIIDATEQYPVVGDYVMVNLPANPNDDAIIHHILPRKTLLTRGIKEGITIQPTVANIDTVFITVSLNENFNLRRIERYLVIVNDSHAKPVILLTKSDQCNDISTKISEVTEIAPRVPIITTSLDNFKSLSDYILPGKTSAFIGSSGVGKSTIINHLLGYGVVKTLPIRENDSKGRHTTTTRQLFTTNNGAMIIDTPGMREMQINFTTNDVTTFEEIEVLSQQCHFKNCHHRTEPGCAIRSAISDGKLSEKRFRNYQKLQRETLYANLNNHDIESEKFKRFYGSKSEAKRVNHYTKKKDKYKYDNW